MSLLTEISLFKNYANIKVLPSGSKFLANNLLIGEKPLKGIVKNKDVIYLIEELISLSELKIVFEHINWLKANMEIVKEKYNAFGVKNMGVIIICHNLSKGKIYLDLPQISNCRIYKKEANTLKEHVEFVFNKFFAYKFRALIPKGNLLTIFDLLIKRFEKELQAISYEEKYGYLMIKHRYGILRLYLIKDFFWLNLGKRSFRGIRIEKKRQIRLLDFSYPIQYIN